MLSDDNSGEWVDLGWMLCILQGLPVCWELKHRWKNHEKCRIHHEKCRIHHEKCRICWGKNIFAEEKCEKKMMTRSQKWGFLPMGAENHRYIGVSSTLEPSHTFPRYLLHPMNPSPKWKFGLKTCLTTPLCMMTWGFVLEKVTPTGRVSMCSRAAFFRPRLVCFGAFGARARRFSKPKVHFGRGVFG